MNGNANSRIDTKQDPMGQAIHDFYHTGKAGKLRVMSSMFYEDEIPVATFFALMSTCPYKNKKR